MGDFLAESNIAGQTLLRLVSRANAIVAELLRLSTNIPDDFRLQDPAHNKYTNILFDFRYIKSAEYCEAKAEQFLDIDAEFKENHMEILRRFYSLFESIYKYGADLLKFLEELEDGLFIQQTLESVLLNQSGGKQLMAEALYLMGVILILLDTRIEGEVRERMLISHLRYKGQSELPLIDEVCALCASTGFSIATGKKPNNYPEEYFARWKVPPLVVRMVIGRLRSDDIYNQIACYPLPEHRSTALATQAAMLYVVLYFAPDALRNEAATMREVVDKHFSDNWVFAFYLGYLVDLSVAWEPYRAAKGALANSVSPENCAAQKQRALRSVDTSLKAIEGFLIEGVLTDDYVMDHTGRLMSAVREANVTLRWLFLHTNAQNRKMKEFIMTGFDPERLLLLLLKTAQFEYVLKGIFERLLRTKQERWEKCKNEAQERMKELGDYYSGEKALTRVKKNENLQRWFHDIAGKTSQIDYADATAAGRKIQQLMKALESVEQFPEVEDSLQVKQFLHDTRGFLTQMVRIVNIKEEHLEVLSSVADMAYGWEAITAYVELMQRRIKADPGTVLLLRATFLKLASILDLRVDRIQQARSPDFESVSHYYSSELVAYVRRVLEVIPRSMFVSLREIIDIQTNKLQEMPTKLEKEKVKDLAQLDVRFALAKATHAISLFTEGMLAMQTTLVGVIRVDPRRLLEDGIRKELVQHIAQLMHSVLSFKTGRVEELEQRLKELAGRLDGLRRSFQYIQDYVNIYALKIWQEEFSRIVAYNVEQECSTFLRKKVYDWASVYQSRDIPIPRLPPDEPPPGRERSVNFVGRLARELLAQSDFRRTLYIDHMAAWYSREGRELVGLRSFQLLLQSISVFGLRGLDQLYCFMIVKELQTFVSTLRTSLDKNLSGMLRELSAALEPTTTIPKEAGKLYNTAVERTSKVQLKCKNSKGLFLEVVCRVGQMQLLRRQIANILNFSCKLDANVLHCALETFNASLLADIQAHYAHPDTKPYPGSDDDNPLLVELSRFLETAGISDPFTKIYITTDPLDAVPLLVFLFAISVLPKFTYSTHLGILMPGKNAGKKEAVDATALVVGIISLLKQFHSSHTQHFLALLGQYIRSMMHLALGKPVTEGKSVEMPADAIAALVFLEELCRFSGLSRKVVEGYVPAYCFDTFTRATQAK